MNAFKFKCKKVDISTHGPRKNSSEGFYYHPQTVKLLIILRQKFFQSISSQQKAGENCGIMYKII